jgi:hypothetical protein
MQFKAMGLGSLFILVQIIACGSSPSSSDPAVDAGGGASGHPGVACGTKKCQAPTGYTGEMCCHDPISGTCGLLMGPGMCGAIPPQQDPKCPDGTIALMDAVAFVRGCCVMGTNDCGVNVYASAALPGLSLGDRCDTLEAAEAYAKTGQNATVMSSLPAPTHCDGTPAM